MLWAACYVGFFGFLRGGEVTVNSPFDPSLHLTLANIQVDAHLNPQSVHVFIECSKTDGETLSNRALCLPWSWSRPSMCCGFLGKLPSSSWTETRTSISLPGWYSSFQIQALCILKIYSEVGRCSWKFIWSYL